MLITLIIAAITYGTPLLFGTLGEILTEKSGNLNLGVEGIMFMGGALGLGGVYYYEKLSSSPNGFVAILVGIFFAFLAGAIASLIVKGSDEQKAKIAGDIEKLNASAGWTKMLADKGWANTYLAGDAFMTQLDADIAATDTVLRDIGLVK